MVTPSLAAEPEPVPINTDGWADSPFISRDGQRLYFTYSRWNLFPLFTNETPKLRGPDRQGLHHVDDVKNAVDESDMYVATRRSDGSWSEAVPLPFNSPGADSTGMEAGNGFYFSHSTKPGGPLHIYVSYKDKTGKWTAAEPLSSKISTEQWIETNPHVAPTQDAIWFSSNRPGGYGGMDLYFSQKTKGEWTSPVNLGPVINSSGDEDQAWVAPDGSGNIYFNRGGIIMHSVWKDGSFTQPEAMPFPIDDPAARISFTDDGNEAYFVSADFVSKRNRIMHMTKDASGNWNMPEPVD